jgi:Mg-chelatase subunit ChlD
MFKSTMKGGLAFVLMLWTTLALAAEPAISNLDRIFAYTRDIPVSVPSTTDAYNVVQLTIKAPQNIRDPKVARFIVNNQHRSIYHYEGYSGGAHSYLVAIPKSYSGSVTVGAYIDKRMPISDSYSRTRDQLLKNTVILGANDIVLLVDISGSMNTNGRMSLAQQVVNSIGPKLEAEGNNVAVIQYASSATVRLHLDPKFKPLSFSASGGTGTHHAINTAVSMLNGRPSPGKIIIDITDGMPSDNTATRNAVNNVVAKASQGWSIASLGMDIEPQSYYPIRQRVTSSTVGSVLEGQLANLIKTAEEQVRDVDSICSGNRCDGIVNDTNPPTAKVETISQCSTAVNGDDFRIILEDEEEAGIKLSSIKVKVDFGDAVLDVPYRIENQEEVTAAQNAGVAPQRVVLVPDNVMNHPQLKTYFHRANYLTEDKGGRKPYKFIITVGDMDNHTKTYNETFDPLVHEDRAAPQVEILTGERDDILRHVGDLTITARDDKTGMDPTEANFAIIYHGQRAEFYLPPSNASPVSTNVCVARYPLELTYTSHDMIHANPMILDLMADAFETGEPITIEAEFIDFAKNKRKVSRELTFLPEVLTTDEVRIPGLAHQFNTTTSRPALSVPTNDAAFLIDRNVRYYARLVNQGDELLTVNGIEVGAKNVVEFGEFTLSRHGSIDLDFASTADRVTGDATLILLPSNETARAIRVPVKLWMPDTQVVSKDLTPVQLYERVHAGVEQKNSVACQLSGYQHSARYADPINNPLCYVEWTELPTDTYAVNQNVPEITGFIPSPGIHKFAYRVKLYDTDGTEFIVDEGEGEFDVVPAKDVMRFTLGNDMDDTYRVIREVTGRMTQSAGPSCSTLTRDSEIAYNLSAMNRPACLISWDAIPPGITMYDWTDAPMFDGTFDIMEGDARFAWTISSFSTSGQPVHIMTGAQVIPLIDPPKPIITIEDRQKIVNDLYWAPMKGGYIGDYNVEAVNAPMHMELYQDGELKESDVTYAGFSDMMRYRSRVMVDNKPLWTRTPMQVQTRYVQLPQVGAAHDFEILSVPDHNLRPEIDVESTTVLNTDEMVVDARIMDPYNSNAPYNVNEMGSWNIRMLNYLSFSRQEPLSEFQAIDGEGKATFRLDLLDLDTPFIRILPEAELISPVPEYTRTVVGSRPLYITVLRGEAIESSVSARRVVGEAPLALLAKLDLANRLDHTAIGKVTWQVRRKGAGAWEALPGDERMPDRLYHTFGPGEYELRAHVVNKHSGAEFTTEFIEIHAFNVPQVDIEGPSNAFIGDTANMRAVAYLNGRDGDPVPEDDLVIQWSEDNGESWVDGGATYQVSRDQEERVQLAVRVNMKDSPSNFEDAQALKRIRVAFRPVKPPRIAIYGDRVIESEKLVNWRGMARAPYPKMDVVLRGRFILPSGEIRDAEEVVYMPTPEDAMQERVEVAYEAWIEGFKDQGAHDINTRRIRVWEYEWPNWQFYGRLSTSQAPANLSLRMRNPGGSSRYLEDLSYEWDIPEGVQVTDATHADGRVMHIAEPGEYDIRVRITDSRGNESNLMYPVRIDPADSWNVGFRLSKSSQENRAPLTLRFIPDVKGGHPRDRITNYRYYLNGEAVSDGNRYASLVLEEGVHELGLEIESDFGATTRYTESLEVLPNLHPVCTLTSREVGNGWRFTAKCDDPDGYIQNHEWVLNGDKLAVSGSRISVSTRQDAALTLTLKAIDNGGAESAPVHWSGYAKGEGSGK